MRRTGDAENTSPEQFQLLERLHHERHSCRGFLPDSVSRETQAMMFGLAQRTASWCNAQPWQVIVTSGAATESFQIAMLAASRDEPAAPDFPWPSEYRGVYQTRRRECGLALYESVGIQKGDREASARQAAENYRLFGAPQWNPAVTAGNAATVRKGSVAASYSVGPARFVAGYRWGNDKDTGGNVLLRDDYYWIGANYQATAALALSLGYFYDNLKTLGLSASAPAVNPANPWQISFLADYTLSKRTDIYLAIAYAKNSGLNFDTSAIGFANGYFPSQGSNNQYVAAVGICHKF